MALNNPQLLRKTCSAICLGKRYTVKKKNVLRQPASADFLSSQLIFVGDSQLFVA